MEAVAGCVSRLCGAGLWCGTRTTILAEFPPQQGVFGVDEVLLRERLQEATARHMWRNDLNLGSDIEQLCSLAYRTIYEAHPLQPFVGADGKQMSVDERSMDIVKEAVRSNYRKAMDGMRGIKTQREIAEDVGVGLRTLQSWFDGNGLFRISADTCARLCNALSVTVDELRGTSGVGRGLVSAYSKDEFAVRYGRLSYHHQLVLSLLVKDFLGAEATESLLHDYMEAIEEASTK